MYMQNRNKLRNIESKLMATEKEEGAVSGEIRGLRVIDTSYYM